MSSPIAHCSLLLAFWPAARRSLAAGTTRRRWLIGAAILFALMAPDLDAVMGPLVGTSIASYHNGPTHSLMVAMAFGMLFGLVCKTFWPADLRALVLLGAAAYTSHILLDWLSWGPGVLLLWPFLPDTRFASPVPLFLGVRHSVNAPWTTHLLTVANDSAFAIVVWIVSRTIARRGRTAPSNSGG